MATVQQARIGEEAKKFWSQTSKGVKEFFNRKSLKNINPVGAPINNISSPQTVTQRKNAFIKTLGGNIQREFGNLRFSMSGLGKRISKMVRPKPMGKKTISVGPTISPKKAMSTNVMAKDAGITIGSMARFKSQLPELTRKFMDDSANAYNKVLNNKASRFSGRVGRGVIGFGLGLAATTGLSLALSKTRHGRNQ